MKTTIKWKHCLSAHDARHMNTNFRSRLPVKGWPLPFYFTKITQISKFEISPCKPTNKRLVFDQFGPNLPKFKKKSKRPENKRVSTNNISINYNFEEQGVEHSIVSKCLNKNMSWQPGCKWPVLAETEQELMINYKLHRAW